MQKITPQMFFNFASFFIRDVQPCNILSDAVSFVPSEEHGFARVAKIEQATNVLVPGGACWTLGGIVLLIVRARASDALGQGLPPLLLIG